MGTFKVGRLLAMGTIGLVALAAGCSSTPSSGSSATTTTAAAPASGTTSPQTTAAPTPASTVAPPPTTAATTTTTAPAKAVTLVSQSGTTTASLPPFKTTANWSMHWSYTCSAYNSSNTGSAADDLFSINITSSGDDIGPDKSGKVSDSGTDYFQDIGTASISVITSCSWTISASQP